MDGDSACLYLLCFEMNVKRLSPPRSGVLFCSQAAGLVNKACCHIIPLLKALCVCDTVIREGGVQTPQSFYLLCLHQGGVVESN